MLNIFRPLKFLRETRKKVDIDQKKIDADVSSFNKEWDTWKKNQTRKWLPGNKYR